MGEYEFEPIRGLPEGMPPGEEILWQGAPDPWVLARRALHLRKVAVYFGLLVIWRLVAAISDGGGAGAVLFAVTISVLLALTALGLIAGVGWLMSKTTVYTITNRRVVMRFGIVLPLSFNVPFRIIQSAELKAYGDGSGDLSLSLSGTDRMSYAVLWPHARPWQVANPQPSLRALRGAAGVAEVLSRALLASLAAADEVAAPATDREMPRREPQQPAGARISVPA